MTQSDEDELRRMLASSGPRGSERGPQPISEILSRLMARRGYAHQQNALEWSDAWSNVAGSQASQTRLGKFNRGVLDIVVRNSAVLQELTFRKKHLLQALQQRVPQCKVKDLRFRVGEIA